MKSPSTDIFDLIQSLSKPERRYFQVYANRHFHDTNQYAKLFQLIEKQQVYDETALHTAFSSLSPGHFSVLKKQLYENVLEAMHRYDEFADPEQKISKGLHFCNLLLKKGLFDQCKKQIKKYKKLAYSYQKFENIIEFNDIEKRLITKTQFSNTSFSAMQDLSNEQNTCLQQLKTTDTFWIKSNTIYKLHYEKQIAAGKDNKELHQLMQTEEYQNPKLASTFKAKLDQLQIQALFAFVQGDTENAYQKNSAFLKLIDDNTHLKLLFADRYFSALNNYLIDSLLLKKYESLLEGITRMRSLSSLPEFKHIQNLEANVFRLSYLLEMNYYISGKHFQDAIQCIPKIETGLKLHREKIPKPNIITLRYLCAYAHFCNADFTSCLSQIHHIFKIKEAESIADLYRDSRMMQLLCHFELGDYFLVESQIISFQRYILSHKIKSQTFTVIMRFVKQYAQKLQKPKRKDLEKKLTELSQLPDEQTVFNNLNYLYWISSVSNIK